MEIQKADIPSFELGRGEIERWRIALDEVGAVRFPGVATPGEVKAIQTAVDELSETFVSRDIRVVNGIPIRYGRHPDGSRYVQRFAFSSLYSDVLREFLHDPRFEPVRTLCGEGSRIGDREKDGVVINHYRNEPGSRYRQLGWHTDGLRDVFYGRLPGPMYNVGYYVDDSPVEKGALRFLPGSHRQGLFSMAFRKLYFLDTRPDPDEVVVEAQAGDLTIHDGRLWHRVALARCTGAASQRRTLYVPYLQGAYEPKDENSPTPFYHRLQFLAG
ncbi:MAG: phytanoyl-CoA dioxygenase family protein [Proteobacteria bacterium]|nr:phytanoyl-CoA dioxygenase family protein [Pseudomonadota bacterium]